MQQKNENEKCKSINVLFYMFIFLMHIIYNLVSKAYTSFSIVQPSTKIHIFIYLKRE